MLAAPFYLALELPPLAFGPALSQPFTPPRELVCTITDLGSLRMPTGSQPPIQRVLVSASFRPDPRKHLVGPVTDGILFFGLTILAHNTGGYVTPEAWSCDQPWLSQRK